MANKAEMTLEEIAVAIRKEEAAINELHGQRMAIKDQMQAHHDEIERLQALQAALRRRNRSSDPTLDQTILGGNNG